MQKQNIQLDFSNQKVFIGIDVHKQNWVVTVRMHQIELKTFSMESSSEQLINHLEKNYPKAIYYSVYEAGFSGFWLDRELKGNGINNIVVNAADIPTTGREKDKKDDHKDSRKLARELENQTITGIYLPETSQEELRSLCRIRSQFAKEKARLKNRIQSYLLYYGKEFPGRSGRYWSKPLITKLRSINYSTFIAKDGMEIYLEELINLQDKLKKIENLLKESAKKLGVLGIIEKLRTIPGIGFITAITIYTEIIDITRFKKLDQLCCYIGLVPSTHSSGEKERITGLSKRQKKYLKRLLIEAAWIAIRKDPALTMSYLELLKRMGSQKAIIKIAKKLLNRIRYVWKNNKEYQVSVVG